MAEQIMDKVTWEIAGIVSRMLSLPQLENNLHGSAECDSHRNHSRYRTLFALAEQQQLVKRKQSPRVQWRGTRMTPDKMLVLFSARRASGSSSCVSESRRGERTSLSLACQPKRRREKKKFFVVFIVDQ